MSHLVITLATDPDPLAEFIHYKQLKNQISSLYNISTDTHDNAVCVSLCVCVCVSRVHV